MKILFIISFFFLCSSVFGNTNLEQNLKRIPFRERVYISYFFDYLVSKDHLGHVLLFDQKPACLTGQILKNRLPYRIRCRLIRKGFHDRKLFMRGWKYWQKHEHLFPHENFIFSSLTQEKKDEYGSSVSFHLYVINKQSLSQCLNNYEDRFQELLGEDFSKNQFISQLEQGINLESLVKNDQELIGILLGYGQESASHFKERAEHPNPRSFPRDKLRSIKCSLDSKKNIRPIRWAGDPESSEVKQLVKTYASEYQLIYEEFPKKGSLKFILKRLCATDESFTLQQGLH